MSLRWGIVSAGKISNDFTNSVNSYPERNHSIVAVAARDQGRAKNFAEMHKIKHVFETYEAMAKSKEIDIAYIGALNPDHYRLTKLFLENNKHVLCEKPMCLNEKLAKELVILAKEKKRFLMEAVWSRCLPSYIALEKELESGVIGTPIFVEVNFGVEIQSVDRLSKKALGGSAILDLGVYVLQFAQLVFKDEPIKVTTTGELNEEGVDEVVTTILEYRGSRKAVLNISTRLKLWNKATVVGTKGRLTLSDPFHASVEIVKADGTAQKFPLYSSKLPYNFENSAGLVYEANEVKRCIEKGLLESPRMSHKESLTLAKLQDTIRKQLGVQFNVD